MNCKTIAIINQKGGVGKSTTAAALTYGLHENRRQHYALAIDLDAQCNLTYSLGGHTNSYTSFDVLRGDTPFERAILETAHNNFYIAASKGLSIADVLLSGTGKEYKLKEAIKSASYVMNSFEYVIIDTPPNLGVLTVNALTAADYVVIPAQADVFSLQGIDALAGAIAEVRKYCNPKLKIAGILLTRYNPRTVLSKEVRELATEMAAKMQTKVFDTTIRESVTVKEAQMKQQSLFEYAPKAPVTEDYRAFMAELNKTLSNLY